MKNYSDRLKNRDKYRNLDFLSKKSKSYKKKIFFTILLLIIIFLLSSIYKLKDKQIKICLCVIGKKENLYAKEFVDHYKKLGYNKIFIYDNNDINDERFEDIIRDDINNGFVSIINFRGYKAPQQIYSYQDCYRKNNLSYNWLSFFDFDEFLELRPKNIKIQKFLNKKGITIAKILK